MKRRASMIGRDGVSFSAEQAANVAMQLNIEHQTVNHGYVTHWAHEMPLAELERAEKRLHKESSYHETRAMLPILFPFFAAFLFLAMTTQVFQYNHEVITAQDRNILLVLSGVIAFPCWFSTYDMRRKHRKALIAVEALWAQVVAEIAVQKDRAAPRRRALRKKSR